MEELTPCLEIAFRLVQNISSMHDKEFFATKIGLSVICAYQDDDVKDSIS